MMDQIRLLLHGGQHSNDYLPSAPSIFSPLTSLYQPFLLLHLDPGALCPVPFSLCSFVLLFSSGLDRILSFLFPVPALSSQFLIPTPRTQKHTQRRISFLPSSRLPPQSNGSRGLRPILSTRSVCSYRRLKKFIVN